MCRKERVLIKDKNLTISLMKCFYLSYDNTNLFYTRLDESWRYLVTGQPSHHGGSQESRDCGEHVGYSHQSPYITKIRPSKFLLSFYGTAPFRSNHAAVEIINTVYRKIFVPI